LGDENLKETEITMKIHIAEDAGALGKRSAALASAEIRQAIAARGQATIIIATGASQFDFLHALTADSRINWGVVTVFHLDEYVGLSDTHPASFRKYLRERFVQQLPAALAAFHEVNGSAGNCCTKRSRRYFRKLAGCVSDNPTYSSKWNTVTTPQLILESAVSACKKSN
jgi:6-phosphogluconolactonase/glucosamine-6-phosphate isomerase/deaminase